VEVLFAPEVQARLDQIARNSGTGAVELVQRAVAGFVEEIGETSELLGARYEEVRSGQVELANGGDVFERLREKSRLRGREP
jgi:predicted DNA-binding protein